MRASFLSLFFAGAALALPKITRTGKYLYDESGSRFFIKGIAYQKAGTLGPATDPSGFPEPVSFVDGLADATACTRDIPNLQKLSVNAIRVYSVDAALNHDACMSQLSAAGIYTIIDLSLPVNGSISRATPTWTSNLLNLYLSSIDAFLKYDNVLAFNIGNEVVIDTNSTVSAPFIKAAARDIKAYLKSKSSSALVGYASTDGAGWRDPLAAYLTCNSADTSIDLWGLNDYRWCGAGSVSSAYQESLTSFANLPVAAYFSEYGCNTVTPRTWTEVAAIYGDSTVAQVYSGGVAFSYFPTNDAKDFGLTTLSGDTITTTVEFDNLAAALTKITTFITTPAKSAATQPAFSTCPAASDSWTASPDLPPTPNQAACDCTWKVASCIFTPQTTNQNALFSPLFASACTLLAQSGGSCDDINANGATGVYGQFSSCDSATKLTHVFSEFYLATNANAQSCNFAGNATVQGSAPTDTATITSQISNCFSNPAVFTPSAPTTTPIAITTTSGTTTATQKNGGAACLLSRGQTIAIAATGFVGALGAFVVL